MRHPIAAYSAILVTAGLFAFIADRACISGAFAASIHGPCWIAWLYPWQTLLTGIFALMAAIGGGYVVWRAAREQMRTADRHRTEDIERREIAYLTALRADSAAVVGNIENAQGLLQEAKDAVSPAPDMGERGFGTSETIGFSVPATFEADWQEMVCLPSDAHQMLRHYVLTLRRLIREIDRFENAHPPMSLYGTVRRNQVPEAQFTQQDLGDIVAMQFQVERALGGARALNERLARIQLRHFDES